MLAFHNFFPKHIIVVFNAADWPRQDKVPDISQSLLFSSEVWEC